MAVNYRARQLREDAKKLAAQAFYARPAKANGQPKWCVKCRRDKPEVWEPARCTNCNASCCSHTMSPTGVCWPCRRAA